MTIDRFKVSLEEYRAMLAQCTVRELREIAADYRVRRSTKGNMVEDIARKMARADNPARVLIQGV
jgi:hypothetical protein